MQVRRGYRFKLKLTPVMERAFVATVSRPTGIAAMIRGGEDLGPEAPGWSKPRASASR